MNLRALTNGSVTGSASFSLDGYLFGGAVITADGTNTATVTVTKPSDGKVIFKIETKTPILITAPIDSEGEGSLDYSVSGTGAKAQFYEWKS